MLQFVHVFYSTFNIKKYFSSCSSLLILRPTIVNLGSQSSKCTEIRTPQDPEKISMIDNKRMSIGIGVIGGLVRFFLTYMSWNILQNIHDKYFWLRSVVQKMAFPTTLPPTHPSITMLFWNVKHLTLEIKKNVFYFSFFLFFLTCCPNWTQACSHNRLHSWSHWQSICYSSNTFPGMATVPPSHALELLTL